MPADPQVIDLQIDPDARLAAAAGGAARYLADAAGLDTEAVSRLREATVTACLEAFQSLTPEHPFLRVICSRFADRIEIALAHEGASAPAVGLDFIAGFAGEIGAPAGIPAGVDRVQYDSTGGQAVTRLTKYLSSNSAST